MDDPMDIEATEFATPVSPALERSHTATATARPPPPSNRPPLAKRVSFDVPPRSDEPKRHRISPPPPVQPTDTITSPATPAAPTPPTINLLPSIFLPFHGVPTAPSSTPLTRESTLIQTIDNLTTQKKAAKRLQIHLALQERDHIIVTERAKARAAAEGGVSEASQDVTAEEMDAIISRVAARPDPKKTSRDFEFRGGDWIRDPAERERWKRPKGEELGRGAAEKVLALSAEAAAKMKAYELQSNLVVEGKKRALENERKRMGPLGGTGGEGSGATS